VYFPIQKGITGTGRPVQSDQHLTSFLENDRIPKSVLINPVVLTRPVELLLEEIKLYLDRLISRYNIVGVTVVNLSVAEMIKSEFPMLEITASTLMDINNAQQLVYLNGKIDVIVPSSKILRDIGKLRSLRSAFKGRIRLLVNESCLPLCLFRTQHFYEMADFSNGHPESLCNRLLDQHPWMRLTGSWILPQHLHFFEDLYDEIKLAGRVTLRNPQDYFHVIEKYFSRKKLNENKIGGGPASIPDQIIITDDFYRNTLYCDKNCSQCTYCEEYWRSNAH
jgi:hypothetical protein